ncbi:MAG: protein kinase [Cellvibrionaceae bacterium]|nr:protein kinase [Cellvibrionaceae bacterium]
MSELPRQIAHYQLQRLLGEGGMGSVYLADDLKLQRQVAVKCIRPGLASDSLKQRLQREARTLAQLNHPGIVQIYDVIEGDDGLALVMELVEGQSLRQHLRENLCSQQQLLQFLIEISEALGAAHQAGIIHRDLKLDNILMAANGRLKLTDFGIAKTQGDDSAQLTQRGKVSGSLSAMSPEQIKGETLTPAADIFSFGILATRLFGAAHPFGDASKPLLLLGRIVNDEPKDLLELGAEVPAPLAALVLQTLAKDPARRPQSALLLAQQLRQFHQQLSAEPGSELTLYDFSSASFAPRAAVAGPGQRYWWLGLAALLLLAMGLGLWQGLRQNLLVPVRYVAVLPPNLTAGDQADYSNLRQSIYHALQDGVIDLENLQLIEAAKVEAVAASGVSVASALNADIVLHTQLHCAEQSCQLQLDRREAGANAATQHSTLVSGDLLEIYQLAQQNLANLFAGRSGIHSLNNIIDADDYQQFVEIKLAAKNDKLKNLESLRALEQLQSRAPAFAPIYTLYTKLSLDEYVATEEREYLQGLKRLLKLADAEFKTNRLLYRHWFEYYLHSRERELALKQIENMSSLGAEASELETLRAYVALQGGDYGLAETHLERAISLRPSVLAYRNLAKTYWYQGKIEPAVVSLRKGLAMHPKHTDSLQLLGALYMTSGQLDLAEATYLKTIGADPSAYQLMNLGLTYMLKRQYQQADKYLSRALQLSPSNPLCVLNVADNYQLMGATEKAVQHYQWLIQERLDDNNWSHLRDVAQAHIHLGQVSAALRAVERAEELAPDNLEVAYSSALVYSVMGDFASALIWTEKALQRGMDKVWFSLPWFDGLCASTEYGRQFGALLQRPCSP